ncbi:MAG TPA: DUF4097 family beta strand repeat-containing protein [Candidatus Eisenbacteria bacterium]|jgi:hypothetical protein
MKRITFTMVALMVVAGKAVAGEIWREQSVRVVGRQGISAVEVTNARGRVDARPSADGQIHVTALKIVRASDETTRRRLAQQTVVEAAPQGGRYVVRVRYPQRSSIRIGLWESFAGVTWPRVEVRIVLEVPADLPVALNGTSADLFTDGLAGPQTLKTTSGDAEVHDARGPMEMTSTSGDLAAAGIGRARISTVSGDLDIAGARGAVFARTTSGDVLLRNSGDSLRIETVSGDVHADHASRDVYVHTTSGDIQIGGASGRVELGSVSGEIVVALAQPLIGAEVETSSGDIRATLATDLGCRLEMRTSAGSIEVGLPVETRTVTRREVSAVVRGGTTPVSLRTGSGSIVVTGGGK